MKKLCARSSSIVTNNALTLCSRIQNIRRRPLCI